MSQFTWGDSVRLKSPQSNLPFDYGEVVGFYEITTEKVATARGYPVGTIFCTVEFPDGSAKDVLESSLIPLENK